MSAQHTPHDTGQFLVTNRFSQSFFWRFGLNVTQAQFFLLLLFHLKVGLLAHNMVGLSDAAPVGTRDGRLVGVIDGARVGREDGADVGVKVGGADGIDVGVRMGEEDGIDVGVRVGAEDGRVLGTSDESLLGLCDGWRDLVGDTVGVEVINVGRADVDGFPLVVGEVVGPVGEADGTSVVY